MASIKELKERIDLHDLAQRMGLVRPGGERGNYRSPHHDDKTPSVSIYAGGKRYKDFSSGRGGTCIDFVMDFRRCEVTEAIRWLHEEYQIPLDPTPAAAGPQRERSRAEFIADQCAREPEKAIEYLAGRGIDEAVIRHGIAQRAIGYNAWTTDQAKPQPGRQPAQAGEVGYGGPAAAFIARTLNPGHVAAVDLRYIDPALNGGVKTMTQGEKAGVGWYLDRSALLKAHTVYIVESAINVLSIATAAAKGVAAFATRGTGNVDNIDWHWLAGKRVRICMDNDAPDEHGHRPGPEAAWALYDRLTELNIAALLVDQAEWEWNDVNDALQDIGAEELRRVLARVEPWAIPGLPGNADDLRGRPRVYLPPHDYAKYYRYRCKPDFTTYVAKVEKDPDAQVETEHFDDLCGFRIAAIRRVAIASAKATMTGDVDHQPREVFSITIQTPVHGNELQRFVIEYDKLHNAENWKRYGTVFAQAQFMRMLNMIERTANLGQRTAINLVGIGWHAGRPLVSEGKDTHFVDPKNQCPYWNLTFPSGSLADAQRVITAYQRTFNGNAAAQILAWGLGAHLKAFLGFWPHMIVQADKGAGKSTLTKALERTIAMTVFSGSKLASEFRILTTLSGTTHPVGWEELSARKQDIIDRAISLLQGAYLFEEASRTSAQIEHLIAAPALLVGEDVVARSLTSKAVAARLEHKGPRLPEDLPKFPVREWLDFLARQTRSRVNELYRTREEYCHEHSRAAGVDDGAARMVGNYAAVLTAWDLLMEFAQMDNQMGDFPLHLIAQMNAHIAETSQDREPWLWIMEKFLSEVAANAVKHPFIRDDVDGEDCFIIRTSHIMDHLQHTMALRDFWNGLTIKSDRVLKRQLDKAGVIVGEVKRTVNGKIHNRMTALSVEKLESYGLDVPMDAPREFDDWREAS